MTKLEALKELENQAETLQKALEEIRALIVAEESPPKPKLIGVPLREAPEEDVEYWSVQGDGDGSSGERWYSDTYDLGALAFGNVFATKEDAEFAAKKRKISAHPIGEWSPESRGWYWDWCRTLIETNFPAKSYPEAYRLWLDSELAFGDEGKAELERRAAAWKELCKEYGIA